MRPMNKLPLAPLMLAARAATMTDLADQLGIDRGLLYRISKSGVPIHRADRFAISLDLHPSTVWGDDFYGPEYL